ncbi:MAG: hypothetical protein JEZ03_04850, partial [Bacteroidales bacterium]|nr:hypothetical protein [Bacteroidales bacterium]
RYGSQYQESLNSAQVSLFGEAVEEDLPDLPFPLCEPMGNIEELKREKDYIGFYLSGHPLDTYKVEMKYFCNTTLKELNTDLAKYANRNVTFAGIITTPAAPDRMTKNGKPFGIFILEDFDDHMEFAQFGEDFIKIKEYVIDNGAFLLIKANIAPRRWGNGDQLEVKITGISLLSEALEKMSKDIHVKVPVENINPELTQSLQHLMEIHSGECSIDFTIFDTADGISVNLPSRRKRVNPVHFVRALSKLDGIDFTLK